MLYATQAVERVALACPICGGANVHLEPGEDGGIEAAAVPFTCDGGDHPFDLRLHSHKGSVYASVVLTGPQANALDAENAAADGT